jgi:hypothetical protein
VSDCQGSQGERGATRAGPLALASAGLSEERARSEPEGSQGEWGATRAGLLALASAGLSEERTL